LFAHLSLPALTRLAQRRVAAYYSMHADARELFFYFSCESTCLRDTYSYTFLVGDLSGFLWSKARAKAHIGGMIAC
jgi:hypothetical protein